MSVKINLKSEIKRLQMVSNHYLINSDLVILQNEKAFEENLKIQNI